MVRPQIEKKKFQYPGVMWRRHHRSTVVIAGEKLQPLTEAIVLSGVSMPHFHRICRD